MQRLTFAVVVAALIVIALIIPTAAAQRRTVSIMPSSIARVSPLQGNGWNVQLSDGTKLFVELRAFDTAGRAPRPGPIANFGDQFHFLGQYVGHATFQQNGRTYHAYRP